MSSGPVELLILGTLFGLGASVCLRDHAGNETSVNSLVPTVWKAKRIQRKEHPDAQRATITAAARALRERPEWLNRQKEP